MCLVLNRLIDIYNNEKKIITDEYENLDYELIEKDNYSISIKLMKIDNTQLIRVCLFDEQIENENKMILSFKLLESDNDLSNEYNMYKNEIINSKLEDFLSKYEKIIEKNIF